MKHLILHLGFHKTGTSYLQLWLYENHHHLGSAGICYPDFHMKHPNRNHHWLAKKIEADTDFDALAQDLDEFSGECDAIVLSAEHLWTVLLADADRSIAFNNAFSKRFRLTLVVYVRRQDEMLESVFAQMVKTRHVGLIENMLKRPMNWRISMDMLASVFGKDSVRVRPYHPPAWKRQHIGYDFLNTADLDLPGKIEEIKRTNESLSRRKTLFLSTLDKSGIPGLAKFVEHVRRSRAIRHDNGRWLLSPDHRTELINKYARSNSHLVKNYLGGAWEEYFLAPPEDADTWFPANPITKDEYHELIKGLWRHSMQLQGPETRMIQRGGQKPSKGQGSHV